MTAVVPASFFESFSKRVKRNKASPICLLASEFHKQQAGRRYVDRNQDHEGPAIPPKMDHWIGNLQGASDTLEKFPVQERIDVVSLSQFYFVQLHGLTVNITRRGSRNADWKYVFLERRRKRGRQRCYPRKEQAYLSTLVSARHMYFYSVHYVSMFFFMPIWDTPWNFQAYQGWGSGFVASLAVCGNG